MSCCRKVEVEEEGAGDGIFGRPFPSRESDCTAPHHSSVISFLSKVAGIA